MNNFELRLFLDYFIKLGKNFVHTDRYSQGEFLIKLIAEFDIVQEICQEIGAEKIEELGRCSRLNISEKTKIINLIIEKAKQLKRKIKPQKTQLEKKLLIIKKIYGLEEYEYKTFVFLVISKFNYLFREYFEFIVHQYNATEFFIRRYLELNYNMEKRIYEELKMRGIARDIHHGEINYSILDVISDPRINTANEITKKLLGNVEKTNLKRTDYPYLKNQIHKITDILKHSVEQKKKGVNILLYGTVGTGKTEFAKLIANCAKIPIYSVITSNDDYTEANRRQRIFDLYSKQRILSQYKNSCILFDEAEDVMNTGFSFFDRSASKGYLNKILETTPVPVIWTTNNIYDVDPAFLRRMTYSVEFEKLTDNAKFNIWNKALKKNDFKVKKSKIKELAQQYDIPPSIITNAIETTKLINGTEDDFEDIVEKSAKLVSKKKDIKKKTKVFSSKDYDITLVNTDISMEQLTENIKKTGKLNFSLCLYGEPGTGKSEYAKYLANNLGIKVVYKKASDLISKYVGETEQNIARAFKEAKDEKAMLIFDEADSFLQNRASAGHSWEVTQVNEMLTWMESHEYPFVCTTNLMNSLDEASLRRFTFKIKFDFMTETQVNKAIEHFFKIKNADIKLHGLTAGDFATVKKKAEFMNITDLKELTKMLQDEIKVKKSTELKNAVGF